MTLSGKRLAWLVLSIAWTAVITLEVIPFSRPAYAAQITNRSLTLQGVGTVGGSTPGGVVNHFFQFTIPTTGNVGSINFQYCTTASGTCTMPTGLVTTSATYGAESGATGFSLVNTTNGAPYITRTAASVTGPQAVSYHLNNITNPDNTSCFGGTPPASNNCTFYVRITTYDAAALGGSAVDTGVVAASTATQIVLTGVMPESLIFCTGHTMTTTNGIPDCSTATTGAISFNQPFSPADTATATSQMSASTNADFGYNITVNGATLTSGSNTVTALNSLTAPTRGLSQFGMNLKANTTAVSTPAVGTEVAPAANGTNYKGEALAGYSTVDQFKFVSGDSVADSANGGAGPSDSQIYTASYIVNVNGAQPIGTYTTTLSYICTGNF